VHTEDDRQAKFCSAHVEALVEEIGAALYCSQDLYFFGGKAWG
jgi:hypothetical protein